MVVSMRCSVVAHLPFQTSLNANTTIENGKMSVCAFALFAWSLFTINKVRRVLNSFWRLSLLIFSAVSVRI